LSEADVCSAVVHPVVAAPQVRCVRCAPLEIAGFFRILIHWCNVKIEVVYFVEVTSSWCYWAEQAWADLKQRYANRPVEFRWKIALLDESALPQSREQLEWFYRRSGTIVRSPFMLNPGWYEPGLKEYLAPNCVAEAAKSFGVTDDRARLALTHAGLREGQKINNWELCAAIAAKAAGLDAKVLLARARSPEIEQRVRADTAEFHSLQVTQRPAFALRSGIGDCAVFSGLAKMRPIAETIDAMMEDAAAYAAHAAHFGSPPPG
jgi:predicted DsbA family dithiol-disulfide isomerase